MVANRDVELVEQFLKDQISEATVETLLTPDFLRVVWPAIVEQKQKPAEAKDLRRRISDIVEAIDDATYAINDLLEEVKERK